MSEQKTYKRIHNNLKLNTSLYAFIASYFIHTHTYLNKKIYMHTHIYAHVCCWSKM